VLSYFWFLGEFVGIYNYFENKWYDLIEKLDKYIPITPIVDRIDKVFPSFILFLLLLLFLILGLIFVFTLNFMNKTELVVLSSSGLPLADVDIIMVDDCGNELIVSTDETGKANIESCSSSFEIVAEKTGYKKHVGLIEPVDGKAVVRLSPALAEFSIKDFFSKIVNVSEEVILGADLEVTCVFDNNKTYLTNQTEDGFSFSISSRCNSIQLKATAKGYQEKTISINQNSERIIIVLEEIDSIGKVFFKTSNSYGDEPGAEVTYTNLGSSLRSTIFTDDKGSRLVELRGGDYSYVAVSLGGQIVQGEFSIEAKQSKDVLINFPAPVDTSDYISLRVISESGSPLTSAKVSVYRDGNYFMQKSTDFNGFIVPIPIINNSPSVKYHAFVTYPGHESAIVAVMVKKLSETPNEVKLRQGGAKLNVNVIDDLNIPQKNAGVALIFSELKLLLFSKVTDNNGNVTFSDLPAGKFTIKAVDCSQQAEASVDETVVKDSTKNIQIVVITGEGKIRFKFLNSNYLSESPNLKLFEVKNNSVNFIANATARAGIYETPFLRAGTKVFVEVIDENFIPTKSIIFEVSRRTQDKEIYLVRPDMLPNNNKVQMKLMQVFSSNPLYGTPTKATQILSGSSYYIEFLTIINNLNDTWLVSDYYVGPGDKNNLDINQIATIGGSKSIIDSLNLLSAVKNSLVIDPLSQNLVGDKAKQANSQLSSIKGTYVVPVILRVDVDANKRGSFDVFFRALHGVDTSLLYKKQFIIGQRFCLADCPIFLFSNYIREASKEFIPASDEPFLLRVGDEYTLKTVVTNSSDTDFGGVSLLLSVPKESLENLAFIDRNAYRSSISLLPLANSAPVEVALTPTKAGSASEKIIQTVEKISNEINLFRDYEGNNNALRLSVKNKEQLEIAISPINIDEGVSYPMFLVKTKYKGKKPVPAYWNARKINAEGNPVFEIANGVTDANGIQVLSFDASDLSKGDRVRFTAYDNNGALEGVLNVFVTTSVPQITPPVYECLTPKLDGVSLFEKPNHYVRLMKDAGVSITINSDCNEDRIVAIHSDLLLSETQFIVPANESKTVILTARPRGELLGVYPVQIITIDSSRYTQLASTDVEIFDDSCFDLSQAVFDLTFNNKINAKVTNKCFSGRKDNFYPKLDISTNSIGFTYNKPGNPEKISFTATVVGSAVEAYVMTYGWGGILHQTSSGASCNSGTLFDPAPEELLYYEFGKDVCSKVVKEIQRREATQKEEPNISATDPMVPFYQLPPATQKAIISEILERSGSASSITGITTSSLESKEPKLNFAVSENEGEYYPSSRGIPSSPLDVTCSLLNVLPWVGEDVPEGYGGCVVREFGCEWNGMMENNGGYLSVVGESCCHPCLLESFGLVDNQIQGFFYTKGRKKSGVLGSGWGADNCSAQLLVQPEFYRTITFMKEVKKIWKKDFNILTSESAVQNLGRYDATPIPKWTMTDTMFDHEIDDAWERGDMLLTLLCARGMGFIPPETAISTTGNYDVGDYNSPLIEYESSGLIKYYIPVESIPENTRVFIKNGRYYVEYFGAPQISSPDINFIITRNNLLGSEYAILTVQDWTGGDTKLAKQFQIKLNGPPSNCYSPEGIAGFTGKEFVPRLLFSWDWNSVAINQCDMKNENYTYCDATQFTISLFKKLVEIQDLIRKNKLNELSLKTGFYSYLIKDNYSSGFLEDFDFYYSNNISSAASYFNTTSVSNGYDQFISKRMISFIDKNTGSSLLSFGGLYRVEINIDFVNETLFSLFDNEGPNAFIRVVLIPIQQPSNYNPFYETPFDGEVGRTQDNFVRKDYGVSIVGDEIKLNGIMSAQNYEDSLVRISSTSSRNLDALQNAPILYYEKGGELKFNPSQPTPVIMNILGGLGPLSVQYVISGTGANTAPNKEWKIISSTINSGGRCVDFENKADILFNETNFDVGKKGFLWNARKAGRIGLATTFFTPKSSPETLRITPLDDTIVSFTSYPNLKNSTIIMLNNYDARGNIDYDTLDGLFKMVGEQKVCMSQNSQEIMRAWWNPEYLGALIKEVNTNKSYSCK